MAASNVSSKLAEWMLKGWVLTDEVCTTEGCPVPLLRSPKGQSPLTTFCANCDGEPAPARHDEGARPGPSHPSPQRQPSLSTQSTSSLLSRSSTPATDISSALSSPTFAPPVDTAETIRRREQSDAASAEIGKRLLKGWAMLGDECPNPRCYGVPLVRPPLAGGGKDPRKECVACATVYIDEKDAVGWERLVPTSQPASSEIPTPLQLSEITEGKEKYADDESLRQITGISIAASDNTRRNSHVPLPNQAFQTSLSLPVLNVATGSLELALTSLSQRMTALSSNSAFLDPASLGGVADAMGKVVQVMAQIKQLHRSDGPSAELNY